MHVQLKPALRRLRRGPGVVQIGVDPRFATVVDGLTPDDERLLDRLAEGLDPALTQGRDRELLRLLTDARVLVRSRAGRAAHSRVGAARERLDADAATWSVVHADAAGDGWEVLAARRATAVEVVGAGRTGSCIALTLAAAGVGQVTVRDSTPARPGDLGLAGPHPDDVGRPRQDVLAPRLAELTAEVVVSRPDLVVLVDHGVADTQAAQALLADDTPHLSVVIREGTTIVGPLVQPGRAPCLRCLDLHRGDRDQAWPRLLAQVLHARRSAPVASSVPEETASSQLAASLAALQVLLWLDGRVLGGRCEPPAAFAATLEIELPQGLVSRRPWPAHPSCGCTWPPREVVEPVQDGRTHTPAATMVE